MPAMTQAPQEEDCPMLDLSGRFCPEVVLAVADFVRNMPAGARVMITATDPLSGIDLPLFAMKAGHGLEKLAQDAGALRFLLTLHRRPPSLP